MAGGGRCTATGCSTWPTRSRRWAGRCSLTSARTSSRSSRRAAARRGGFPPFLDEGPGPDRQLLLPGNGGGEAVGALDLDQAQGRELLCRLADGADFLIESFPVGYLDALGLSYETLAARNPRLIYTSVTPFGDLGPGATWQAADIVGWAAGGMMAMMGAPGRPPLQVSVPQAYSHAGSEAAVASMLAHLDRERSGLGQRVVVSMQAAGVWATNSETAFPPWRDRSLERTGIIPAGSRAPRSTGAPTATSSS